GHLDPASSAQPVRADVPNGGSIKSALDAVLPLCDQAAAEATRKGAALAKWWEQVEEWRGRRCLAYENSDSIIKPQFVIEKLWEVTGCGAIVTSDVGQHQM